MTKTAPLKRTRRAIRRFVLTLTFQTSLFRRGLFVRGIGFFGLVLVLVLVSLYVLTGKGMERRYASVTAFGMMTIKTRNVEFVGRHRSREYVSLIQRLLFSLNSGFSPAHLLGMDKPATIS